MVWKFPKYPSNWDTIRKNVYERDNYTCQRCNEKGGPYGDNVLNCAHKLSKSKGGSDDYSNLETVCEECHIEEHPWMLNNPQVKRRHIQRKKRINQRKKSKILTDIIKKYL